MALDLKDKIRKLLALAENPNEHEAKAALLKARELMAEHKLTEEECMEAAKKEVKDIKTSWSCSKRRDPWLIDLSAVIGEHYCCQSYRQHYNGSQTQTIGFIGLEDDADVCSEIFNYAAHYITAKTKQIKKRYSGTSVSVIRQLADSYGYGFVKGIAEAFEAVDTSEWGLVLSVPAEVQDYTQGFGRAEFHSKTEKEIEPTMLREGFHDGKNFRPDRALKETAHDPVLALG